MTTSETITLLGAVVIPLYIFLYGNYRKTETMKKDEIIALKEDLTTLEKKLVSIPESISRTHQRIDNLEHNHNKLESAVEVRLDKFSDKLEKIYDILVERASGG